MEISVRSYLTAGMAAVVGATAIGLAPVTRMPDLQAAALPAPVVAEIALTGTSIPWETITTLVQALSNGGSLSGAVTSLISSVGTEIVKEAMPLVTALAGDVVKYVGSALADLFTGPDAPEIDLPAILATATAALTSGNFPGAIAALTSGLSVPLNQISKVLFTPDFQAFVIGKVGGVLGALPEILRTAVQTVVGIDIKPLIDALSGLLGGLLPAASTLTATHTLAAATVAAPRAAAAAAARAESIAVDEPAPAVAEDSSAKAPAEQTAPAAAPVDAAPADKSVPAETAAAAPVEAAPEAAPAAEAAPEVVPAPEVAAPVVVETAAPVTAADAPAAEAPAAEAPEAPAAPTRLSKTGARHSSSAKSGESRAGSGRG